MDDRSKMMKMEYRKQQKQQHVLTADEVEKLFHYVEFHLDETGCDNTRRHTESWLQAHVTDASRIEAALAEMDDMGGYCDCEVLMNCYEDYDL